MKNETQDEIFGDLPQVEQVKKDYTLAGSILVSAIILAGAWISTTGPKITDVRQKTNITATSAKTLASEPDKDVLPSEGVVLPVTWGNLGAKLVSVGAIDADKFKAIYEERGAFTD